jgi:hypothetical protein
LTRKKAYRYKMQAEATSKADLWVLAVALYKTSLTSAEDISRWDRHAASFVSHELENDRFVIGVTDPYAAEYYTSEYSDALRNALIRAGAEPGIKVVFSVTEKAKEIEREKR